MILGLRHIIRPFRGTGLSGHAEQRALTLCWLFLGTNVQRSKKHSTEEPSSCIIGFSPTWGATKTMIWCCHAAVQLGNTSCKTSIKLTLRSSSKILKRSQGASHNGNTSTFSTPPCRAKVASSRLHHNLRLQRGLSILHHSLSEVIKKAHIEKGMLQNRATVQSKTRRRG